MPIYEYKCERCQKKFEVIQKFSDEPLAIHEGCGGEVERLVSPSAFQFKGSGWYVTDYARGGKSSSNGSTAKSEGKTDVKAEGKGDTKNAGKPAPAPSSDK
jgi:putative FmdB family regulatory protein